MRALCWILLTTLSLPVQAGKIKDTNAVVFVRGENLPACEKALTKSTFYRFDLGFPHATSALVVDEYHDLIYWYAVHLVQTFRRPSAKPQILTWLKEGGDFPNVELPPSVIERLKKMSRLWRERLETALTSPGSIREQALNVREVFRVLYPTPQSGLKEEEVYSRFEEFDAFLDIGHEVQEVRLPDGRLDVDRLLRTRARNFKGIDTDEPAMQEVVLPRGKIENNLNFVIFRDGSGPRMRIGMAPVLIENEAYEAFGNRHHSTLALGRPVEFAGQLFLTQDGQLYAATLNSGHYMWWRVSTIDQDLRNGWEVYFEGTREVERRARLAAQVDYERLRDYIRDEFKLAAVNPDETNPFVFYVRREQWRHLIFRTSIP